MGDASLNAERPRTSTAAAAKRARFAALVLLCSTASCGQRTPTIESDAASAAHAMRCDDTMTCVDTQTGTNWRCERGTLETGRTRGRARVCTPTTCEHPQCQARPLLTGEVVNADQPGFPRVAAAIVAIWPMHDASAIAVNTTDAQGEYAWLVAANTTYWVETRRDGWWTERHAVHVPAGGWDLPLDQRKLSTFERLTPATGRQRGDVGMAMVEWQGVPSLIGVGASVEPFGAPAVVYNAERAPTVQATLRDGDDAIQVFANLPLGPIKIALRPPPQGRCAIQAGPDIDWRAEAGVLTQVDVQCAMSAQDLDPARP